MVYEDLLGRRLCGWRGRRRTRWLCVTLRWFGARPWQKPNDIFFVGARRLGTRRVPGPADARATGAALHIYIATDNGRLKLSATNATEIAITNWITADVEEEGAITSG